MGYRNLASIAPAFTIVLIAILACNIGVPAQATAVVLAPTLTPIVVSPTDAPTPIVHKMQPAAVAVTRTDVYDVESVDTAPEKRAPYGDSYELNRLERPFLQDMTYLPNLDVATFSIGKDNDWAYVSIQLVGNDPNDQHGIHYAVELDMDKDGFGDYIIWARHPYPIDWDTAPVQIFRDTNHDTSGVSPAKSDPLFPGNGYDTLFFNGGAGDADPDLVWVRVKSGEPGTIQFAFKRAWSGNTFMFGVLADSGLTDPGKLDYVDRMTLTEAGSPVRDNSNYPLKALYAVDNTCRSAFGFGSIGNEPQSCPVDVRKGPRPHETGEPPPGGCPNTCGMHQTQKPYPDCSCEDELY